MAKSDFEIAEIYRAGGNLEPGYAYDGNLGIARKMTADETREAEDAVKAEADAIKKRTKILEAAKVTLPNADVNAGQ